MEWYVYEDLIKMSAVTSWRLRGDLTADEIYSRRVRLVHFPTGWIAELQVYRDPTYNKRKWRVVVKNTANVGVHVDYIDGHDVTPHGAEGWAVLGLDPDDERFSI